MQGKLEEAENLYKKALALKPDNPTYMHNLAELNKKQVWTAPN